jgi:hypothetical protein
VEMNRKILAIVKDSLSVGQNAGLSQRGKRVDRLPSFREVYALRST